jgi:hypothetical protein
MLLFESPSQSPNPRQTPSVPAQNNGASNLQQIQAASREFAVAAAATGSESESVSRGRHNSHSISSSSSIPIHINGTIYDWSSYPSNSNNFGIKPNGINVDQDPRLFRLEPPQPLSCHSNGIGSPLSPTASTSEPVSNSVKTPMEMLAESMKGRMLFAIPKKGAFDTFWPGYNVM